MGLYFFSNKKYRVLAIIDIGGREIEVLHTPGHSPGICAFGNSGRTVGARLNHLMEMGLVKRNGHIYDPKQTYEMVE